MVNVFDFELVVNDQVMVIIYCIDEVVKKLVFQLDKICDGLKFGG